MVVENISFNRRQFLGGLFSTGAFVVASRFVPAELLAQGPAAAILNTKADTAALHPSVYLGIEPDGTVFRVAASCGRTGRRLEPLPHRTGCWRHPLWRSEHRRIAVDTRLL